MAARSRTRFDPRELVMICGGLGVFALVLLASFAVAPTLPWAPFACLGLVLAVLAGWLMMAAWAGSPTAIIIYLAVLAFMTDAQFRVRAAGDISADWQSTVKFALWLGAGAIGIANMPSIRQVVTRPASALWLTYIIIAMVSSIYSPSPGYSFGCSFALLCLFAFSYALTNRLTETQLLWTLALTLAAFCLVGWVVFYADPALGTSPFWTYGGWDYRMCGIAGQANNLGAVCTKFIGAVFLLWYRRRCKLPLALLLAGLGAITLIKSDARTAEIAILAGIAAVLLSRSRVALTLATLAGLLACVTTLVFPNLVDALAAHVTRSGDTSELYTLTGRLAIWQFAWEKILESPFYGWGYNAAKVVLGTHYDFADGLMVDSAHNMYLQNLLSVGVIGTLPLVLLLVQLGRRTLLRPLPIVTYFYAAIMIYAVSDTDAIGTTPTLMTLVFFVVSIWPDYAAPAQTMLSPRQPGYAGRILPHTAGGTRWPVAVLPTIGTARWVGGRWRAK